MESEEGVGGWGGVSVVSQLVMMSRDLHHWNWCCYAIYSLLHLVPSLKSSCQPWRLLSGLHKNRVTLKLFLVNEPTASELLHQALGRDVSARVGHLLIHLC